jgi:hypothetical protein
MQADHYIMRVQETDMPIERLINGVLAANGYTRGGATVDFKFENSIDDAYMTALFLSHEQNTGKKIDMGRSKMHNVSGAVTGKLTAIFYASSQNSANKNNEQYHEKQAGATVPTSSSTEKESRSELKSESPPEPSEVSPEEFGRIISTVWDEVKWLDDTEKIAILEKLVQKDSSKMIAQTWGTYLDILKHKDSDLAIKIGGEIGQLLLTSPDMLLIFRLHIIMNIYCTNRANNKNEQIQEMATSILQEMGGPAIDQLISEIRKEAWCFKQAYCLEAIGTMAVPKLIAEMDNPHPFQRIVYHILATIGDKRAVEPLIKALNNKDKKIRQYAGEALQKITNHHFTFGSEDSKKWQKWWDENK